jgi:hypothetical protein
MSFRAIWRSYPWKAATSNNYTDHHTVKSRVGDTCIIAAAHQAPRCLSPLNVRLICDAEVDDANPIELLVAGWAKITAAMARVVWEHEFRRGRMEINT